MKTAVIASAVREVSSKDEQFIFMVLSLYTLISLLYLSLPKVQGIQEKEVQENELVGNEWDAGQCAMETVVETSVPVVATTLEQETGAAVTSINQGNSPFLFSNLAYFQPQ